MSTDVNQPLYRRTAPPIVTGRVVGIDPGLSVTGYAVVDPKGRGAFVVEAGVIRSRTAGEDLGKRLELIHTASWKSSTPIRPRRWRWSRCIATSGTRARRSSWRTRAE